MNATWRRLTIWSVLGAGLVGALLYAFRPQPTPVDLATVVRGALVVSVDEEGETRVGDIFVVSAPVAGRARRILADVGDAVIALQTIVAEIEPIDPAFLDPRSEAQAKAGYQAAQAKKSLAEAELAEAQAEFEFSQTELQRARKLSRAETISERALDEAERRYKMAEASVATARAGLQVRSFELERAAAQLMSPIDTQASHGSCECVPLRAPVDGRVLRVLHESEGVVEAGDPLLEIGDPTNLEIVADFLSSDAVKIAPGQRVLIENWGGEAVLSGRVRLVEPVGFTKVSALGIEEQRVNVIIDFTSPHAAWQRIGHGYQLEVRVVLWEGLDVAKIPLTALFRQDGEWVAFVEEQGRARVRRLTVGQRNGLEAEIVDGIDAGERVIVSPSERITEAVLVRPRHRG